MNTKTGPNKIAKAMLLAAGFGTRLKPLTLETPKPLLPLNGMLLIDHQLKFLAANGIREVVINTHHLGEKIQKHVGQGIDFGIKVHYSEEAEILGTGGGVKKACKIFGNDMFIVKNCDSLIDIDLHRLISNHIESGAAATMAVMELGDKDKYNPVNVDKKGFITGFGEGKHFYAGVQIFGTEMMNVLPPEGKMACLINDGYMQLIKKGLRVGAYIHHGYFNDIGTFARYEKAKKDVADGHFIL